MQKNFYRNLNRGGISLSLFVLFILVAFTYAFFEAPYSGFYFNPSNGKIIEIYIETDTSSTLQIGDTLEQVGPVTWDSFKKNAVQVFFENVEAGQIVNIRVKRDESTTTIPWKFPGFNRKEFFARFTNIWWLAFIFWFFGTALQLFVHPRDVRWRLLIAANYLTALWLIVGNLSASQIWGSSILLHALTWMTMPVYLHLHWAFPKPLGHLPRPTWGILYLAGSAFALGELWQLLPRTLYALGFLATLLGTIVLLIAHFALHPTQRQEVGQLAIAILLATSPSIILSILGFVGNVSQLSPLALIALPIMPGAYFYIVYRRQLGGLEIRANRIIAIYSFFTLLGTLLLLMISFATLPISPEAMAFLTIVIAMIMLSIGVFVFPRFHDFINKHLLGVKLPYQNLQEVYSARITTRTSLHDLLRLLSEEIFPSLLVRQYAILLLDNGIPKALLTSGITDEQLADRDNLIRHIETLTDEAPHGYRTKDDQTYSWIHLILPLNIGKERVGLWLLGRRDPDDLYPQSEIPVLQALANQTAIALSNILQTERLRAMYHADVNRHEEERLHLAHDLHDSVLNQLAVLQMNLGESEQSQKFQEAYEGLTQRLREIVSDLRPPMLNYGLKPAIEDLADKLGERSDASVNVTSELQTDGSRYPLKTELHLFRILQQACENALRHAQAGNIRISGTLSAQEICLDIEDDGIGFEAGESLQLDGLIANKHYGLASMVERAAIIGAEVRINSSPKSGTNIHVAWKPGPATPQ